jgi:hypothetical protein
MIIKGNKVTKLKMLIAKVVVEAAVQPDNNKLFIF